MKNKKRTEQRKLMRDLRNAEIREKHRRPAWNKLLGALSEAANEKRFGLAWKTPKQRAKCTCSMCEA